MPASPFRPLALRYPSPYPYIVFAGPCSAETEEQTFATAAALCARGIRLFRASLWKPRTRPGSFEGVGSEGLPWLKRVERELGMQVATEVASASHVEDALAAGLDTFWIGARTTTSPFAMAELAEALSGKHVTVLVKNPLNPDIELWEGALLRLYQAGISQIGAIPSHIAGRRDLVPLVSRMGLEMNFSGLMVETHPTPDEAWSDAAQQLTPSTLIESLAQLDIHPTQPVDEGMLSGMRTQIDQIDSELLGLIAKRMAVAKEIGDIKAEAHLPIVQPDRYRALLDDRLRQGRALGLDEGFLRELFSSIHEASVHTQHTDSK